MKYIARHTIVISRELRAPDPRIAGDRGIVTQDSIAPGTEIDSTAYPTMTAADWKQLEEQGAIGRLVKTEDDGVENVPVAENTAPLGPASGETRPPDSNDVADAARRAGPPRGGR